MDVDKFKDAIEAVDGRDQEEQVDRLCFQWLKQAMEGNGNEGEIGLELLHIIETRCMP